MILSLDLAAAPRLPNYGGNLKPVTLKPVIRIFCIFRVFVSAFSAFSAFLVRGISSDPFFWGERDLFQEPRKGDF